MFVASSEAETKCFEVSNKTLRFQIPWVIMSEEQLDCLSEAMKTSRFCFFLTTLAIRMQVEMAEKTPSACIQRFQPVSALLCSPSALRPTTVNATGGCRLCAKLSVGPLHW